jgi:hypothetical protein
VSAECWLSPPTTAVASSGGNRNFYPPPPSLQSVNCLFYVREKMYLKKGKCIKNMKNVLKIQKMY